MVDIDWLQKNWTFISKRQVIYLSSDRLMRMIRDPNCPTQGKFWGRQSFIERYGAFVSSLPTGSKRLMLRPFIDAPLPADKVKNIEAMYIDPKKYTFNEQGEITALKCLYESPVYVFIKDDFSSIGE